MTQHDTVTDVATPEPVGQRHRVDTLSTQPAGVALPPHDTEVTKPPAPVAPAPGRRWRRTVAIIAAAAILIGIAMVAIVLRSADDVAEPVTRSLEDARPVDRHLENQARRLDARKADADRFAGRYSNGDGRAVAQPPILLRNGNDSHLHNQAERLDGSRERADADQPRRRPGLLE